MDRWLLIIIITDFQSLAFISKWISIQNSSNSVETFYKSICPEIPTSLAFTLHSSFAMIWINTYSYTDEPLLCDEESI